MKLDESHEKTEKKSRDQSSKNQVSARDLSDDSSDTSDERIHRNISPIRPRSPCQYNDREDTRRIYERVDHYYKPYNQYGAPRGGVRPYRSRGYSRGNNYGHQYYENRGYNESGRGGYDGGYPRNYGNNWYEENNRTRPRGYPISNNRGYYRGYGPRADNGYNRSYEYGYGRYAYDSRRGGYRGRYDGGPREFQRINQNTDHLSRSYPSSYEYPNRYGPEHRRWNTNYSEHALFKRRDDRFYDHSVPDRRQYMSNDAVQERYRPREDSREEFLHKNDRIQFRNKDYRNEKSRYKDEGRDEYYSKELPEAYRTRYENSESKRKHYNQHDNRYSKSSSPTPGNSPKRYRSRSPITRVEKTGSRSEYRGDYRSSGGGGDYRPTYPSSDRKESSYDRGYDPRPRGDIQRDDYYSSGRAARSRSPSATNTRYASQER